MDERRFGSGSHAAAANRTVWTGGNDHLTVSVRGDASAELLDHATGSRWQMGPVAIQEEDRLDVGHVWLRTKRSACEQFPGRFRAIAVTGDHVRFELLGRLGESRGAFTVAYSLDGPWWEVGIVDVDPGLSSLVFPPPLSCDALVLPIGVGRLVREPLADRFYWPPFSALNMRWFGGLRDGVGYLAVLDKGHADAGVMATELAAAPGWRPSLAQWTGARAVRYRIVAGGYVELAKEFRRYATTRGLHRSLAEKAAELPATANLVGGRILSFMQATPRHVTHREDRLLPVPTEYTDGLQVHYRHADVARLVRNALRSGMRRGLVVLRGWVQGGYDERHPDVWPPAEELGSLAELRALCELADPITSALHDNYQDMYVQSPSWPSGVVRHPDGRPMPGGFWDGGQAYILNARDGLRYARRNWPLIRDGLGPRAMFIDTTTAVQLYESAETGNMLARAEDEKYKLELLDLYKKAGCCLGSEEAADFAMAHVDWLENRHRRVPGESVPLWPLVFGDAACATRYVDPLGPEPGAGDGAPAWLTDMLWGYQLSFAEFPGGVLPPAFGDTTQVDSWHARVATAEMVEHRYLAADGTVERTAYDNGAAITVNFAAEPSTVDGRALPPHSYLLE